MTRVFNIDTARKEMTKGLVLKLELGLHQSGVIDEVRRFRPVPRLRLLLVRWHRASSPTLVAALVGQPRRQLEATKAGPEDHDTRRHVQPGCGTMRM